MSLKKKNIYIDTNSNCASNEIISTKIQRKQHATIAGFPWLTNFKLVNCFYTKKKWNLYFGPEILNSESASAL